MEDIIQKLNSASVKLLEPLSLDDTYERITNEAMNLVGGESGVLVLKRNRKLEVAFSTDGIHHTFRNKGNTYTCFHTKKAFVVYAKEFKKSHPDAFKDGFRSGIFIPLYYKDKSFGVLIVRSKNHQTFSKKELEVLQLFGSIASLTIRKTFLLYETKKNLELKDKFISIAAHELRTPLTSMSGFIQLLHRRLSANNSKESEWVESLLQESNRLKELIEEVLEVNRINAGKLQYSYQESNLEGLVIKAMDTVKQMFPSHTIKFEKDGGTKVVGDNTKLSRALFNILENAAKFSSIQNDIIIRLKKNKSYSTIEIQDFGKGIADDELPYIFLGFYKGKENENEGMGLGLFYAKKIIEDHKGKILVDSQKNKGTVVRVQLPVVK